MYFDRKGFSARSGLRVDDKGDVENRRGFKNDLWSSQRVCVESICV